MSKAFCFVSGHDFSRAAHGRMVGALAPATAKSDAKFRRKKAQGLKPDSFCALYGTTEVVPCYKAKSLEGYARLRNKRVTLPGAATPSILVNKRYPSPKMESTHTPTSSARWKGSTRLTP
jgi:hypothetical protein